MPEQKAQEEDGQSPRPPSLSAGNDAHALSCIKNPELSGTGVEQGLRGEADAHPSSGGGIEWRGQK